MKMLLLLCICCLGVFTETKGALPDSSLAYETAIFNAVTEAEVTTLLWQKYYYQKNATDFIGAKQTLNRLLDYQPDNFNIYYEKALMHYILSEFTDFKLELNKMQHSDSLHNYTLAMTVLYYLQELEIAKAKLTFKKLAENNNININIDSVFKPIMHYADISEKKAIMLSSFLPGTGQWYAGSFTHGAINASLILSLLGWGTYNVINTYYATGLFTGYFIAYTFYKGGLSYVQKLVLKHNTTIRVKARNSILPALQKVTLIR